MTLCTYAKGAQCVCMDEKECPHRPDNLKSFTKAVRWAERAAMGTHPADKKSTK